MDKLEKLIKAVEWKRAHQFDSIAENAKTEQQLALDRLGEALSLINEEINRLQQQLDLEL